ncbi:MAG: hypothetical protein NTY48_06390 [Candidatus Diapherotrites archaeon]|nr:hypothetical protein [Candidatus Diapherotrites archaeon]
MAKRFTPTAIIEGSPELRETVWYKKPRKRLVKASYPNKEFAGVVYHRQPRKGETLIVHVHNHKPNEKLAVLPGKFDLKSLIDAPRLNQAFAVRQKGKVLGYTFYHFSKKGTIREQKKKLRRFLAQTPKSYQAYHVAPQTPFRNAKDKTAFLKNITQSKKKLKQTGIRLRFVANKKNGFVFDGTQFKRKTIKRHDKLKRPRRFGRL